MNILAVILAILFVRAVIKLGTGVLYLLIGALLGVAAFALFALGWSLALCGGNL